MRAYWRRKNKANQHDLVFHATALLKWHRRNLASKRPNPSAAKPQIQRRNSYTSCKLDVPTVQGRSSTSPSASPKASSATPVVMINTPTQSTPTNAISTLIASFDALLTMDSTASCRRCLYTNHKTSQCPSISEDRRQVFTRFRDSKFKLLPTRMVCKKSDQVKESFKMRTPPIKAAHLRKKICRRSPQELLLTYSCQLARTNKRAKKALLGASDTQKPEKLLLTSRTAFSATIQQTASKHKKLINKKIKRPTPLSRTLFAEICILKPEQNEVALSASIDYKADGHVDFTISWSNQRQSSNKHAHRPKFSQKSFPLPYVDIAF